MIANRKIDRLGPSSIVLALLCSCAQGSPTTGAAEDVLGAVYGKPARQEFGPEQASVEPQVLLDANAPSYGIVTAKAPIVEEGNGQLIGFPRSATIADLQTDDDGGVTLNVVDADLRDVVRLVLEDGLDANYIMDPAVNGTITVQTSRPVPASELLDILSSVLNQKGAAILRQGDLYKIVPLANAPLSSGPPRRRSRAPSAAVGSTIQVTPLSFADAAELAKLLEPFAANSGSVQIDTVRNTLLLTGTADQLSTMNDLIDMFDVDWMAGMSFGLYTLDVVPPSQLVDELNQIFTDPRSDFASGAFRFVPIDRMNALMVITAQPAYLNHIERWIERLDKVGDGDGEQVYVYAVQNGRAADLASVLGELFDIRSSAVGGEPVLAPGLEPTRLRSSSIEGSSPIADGSAERSDRAETHSNRLDRYQQRELTLGHDGSNTRIVADETSNALLIRALASDYRKIRSALRELDTMPLQVLLEATIAEVTLADELSFGVQWYLGSGDSNITLSEFSNGAVGQIFPGFSGLLSRGDVRSVINALDSISDVKVISSPQILVLDNQAAKLEVGDQVPVVTRQAEAIDSDDARVVNTVEQRQTGVILNVIPRVNASGLVVLDIEQEVSDVVRTTTSGIDSPTIAQRRIGTSVAVGHDQTVALGGLIQDDVKEQRSGVPILQNIPLLGRLFSASTTINRRTELLVLITPKVLRNQQDAVETTLELRRRLLAVEPLQIKLRKPSNGHADDVEQSALLEMREDPIASAVGDAAMTTEAEHPIIGPSTIEPAAGPILDDIWETLPLLDTINGPTKSQSRLDLRPSVSSATLGKISLKTSERAKAVCPPVFVDATACRDRRS